MLESLSEVFWSFCSATLRVWAASWSTITRALFVGSSATGYCTNSMLAVLIPRSAPARPTSVRACARPSDSVMFDSAAPASL